MILTPSSCWHSFHFFLSLPQGFLPLCVCSWPSQRLLLDPKPMTSPPMVGVQSERIANLFHHPWPVPGLKCLCCRTHETSKDQLTPSSLPVCLESLTGEFALPWNLPCFHKLWWPVVWCDLKVGAACFMQVRFHFHEKLTNMVASWFLSNVINYFSTVLVQQNQISPFLDLQIYVYFRWNIIPMFLPHLRLIQPAIFFLMSKNTLRDFNKPLLKSLLPPRPLNRKLYFTQGKQIL